MMTANAIIITPLLRNRLNMPAKNAMAVMKTRLLACLFS